MTVLYGIPNCDSCRAARRWLLNEAIEYRFHDLRADGIQTKMLQSWSDIVGWETLVNKRSRTWKALKENEKRSLSEPRAISLMAAHPTLIKRPVLDNGGKFLVGFKSDSYQSLFAQNQNLSQFVR